MKLPVIDSITYDRELGRIIVRSQDREATITRAHLEQHFYKQEKARKIKCGDSVWRQAAREKADELYRIFEQWAKNIANNSVVREMLA
jgi:hypothetical protein